MPIIRNSAAASIEQKLVHVTEHGKLLALRQIIKQVCFINNGIIKDIFNLLLEIKGVQPPVMIFVKTNVRAKHLYNELSSDQLRVGASHADLHPKMVPFLPLLFFYTILIILIINYNIINNIVQRAEVVTKFRIGEIWFLVCTDLMSRGMDFKNVGCVINYDFPPSRSSYIHRIGILSLMFVFF